MARPLVLLVRSKEILSDSERAGSILCVLNLVTKGQHQLKVTIKNMSCEGLKNVTANVLKNSSLVSGFT